MTLRILFLDDNQDDALLAVLELKRGGLAFEHELISTIAELEPAMSRGPWSAVVSDYNLGGATGLDALRIVRRHEDDVPFVLVSGTIGDERAAEAIREGVNDYVSKDRLARLPLSLGRELDAAAARAKQRHLETSLADAQERYRRTFQQAPIGIAHGGRDGRIISANAAYAGLFGLTPEQIAGKRWIDFVDDRDTTPMTLEQFQKFFDHGREAARFERRYRLADGRIRWANVTLSVMRDADDRPDYVIALLEDITQQKLSSERLHVQTRLLECVEQAVIATDLTGTVTYWNNVAERLYGWSAAEAIGRPILELTPAEQSAAEAAAILARLVGGESWTGEIELARRDGTTFPALVVDSPMYDERGVLTGIVGVSHDLTDQKRTENRLRAHRLQLDAAQEIARVGSWTYDFATGEREWSEGLSRLYGMVMPSGPSLETVFERIHPDDRARLVELQQHAHRNSEPLSAEFRLIRDGEVRNMLTRVHYVFDDGRPAKLLGVVQDITEEKKKEEELSRRANQQSAVANLGQIALTGASIEFLLDQAAAAIHRVLGVDLSQIFSKDDSFLLVAGKGWSEGEVGRERIAAGAASQSELTITTGQPVVMSDVATETRFRLSDLLTSKGVKSGITVPIQSADGTGWGILGAHALTPRNYPAHDVEFLRSIATLIGQAIDRERADAELRTRARQQSAIARLGRLVLNSLDGSVLEKACELLRTGVGADYAFLGELTPRETLRMRAGRAWGALPEEIPISKNAQAGYTILHNVPVVVGDYATETRFDTYRKTVPYGIRSGVMVPVASATRTFGVLSAQSHEPYHFRDEDIDFVQSLANMLAEAMEREIARREVEDSEHRYRRIFEGAKEIIFTIDAAGRFLALSSAFETITGWNREEWIGRPFTDVIVPEDRSRLGEIFRHMLETSQAASADTILLGKDRLVHVDVSSFPQTVDGEIVEVYGFARDVTETRRATQERERVARNLELLLESTIDGIFTLDRDGRCTMVNRAAAAFLRYERSDMLGACAHALLHPSKSESECAIKRVLATGEACSITTDSFVRRDGLSLPVAYSAAPIVDDGQHVGVVVTFTDLSERRKLEARLEQANRLSSLGRLAATVAHEFNNVLMGIAPFVEVVRRSPSPEKVASSLDHIASSVKRGRRITQDILRFTQPAEPVRARVDVQSWLQSVAVEAHSMLTKPWHVKVEVEPLSVEGDANQLHQILMNLILNARDAMPSGGTITISARRERPNARFAFGVIENPHHYAHFLVRDEGCGMAEETLRHAFEPLFTTKKNGTGLGLAVTHQVVLRHGGEIFIESAPGEGTTFHIFLPLAEHPEQVALAEVIGEPAGQRPPRRLLLVEDDHVVAAGLTSLLEYEGFDVALATTGADALLRVRANTFDAVLLDVGLPDMNGQRVYDGIAAMNPSLPVIFSTGHADRSQFEDLLAKPNVSFLLKPYEADSLMDALVGVMI